jgi:hypothetical protein
MKGKEIKQEKLLDPRTKKKKKTTPKKTEKKKKAKEILIKNSSRIQ